MFFNNGLKAAMISENDGRILGSLNETVDKTEWRNEVRRKRLIKTRKSTKHSI
jgi:hypothetical protein